MRYVMKPKLNHSLKFSLTIAVITFVLAAIFSVISSSILNHVTWLVGLIVVLIIVIIGIFFDMLGIASAAADEAPFHAMAAEKVKGAKEAKAIIKNADKFSSFCNDVIGDISGIVSGTATAAVLVQITQILGQSEGSSIGLALRSEERRVGKECRYLRARDRYKKKKQRQNIQKRM